MTLFLESTKSHYVGELISWCLSSSIFWHSYALMLLHAAIQRAVPGSWNIIATNVTWSAKGNNPGTLIVSSRMCGTKVKFVHKSGYVACHSGV